MTTIWYSPSSNFLSTSLNGAINSSVGTITLNSTSGLKAPGYVIIDRQDSTGANTPNAREVVSYTGISGSDLTGCGRGADGSTQRSHSDGALVETMMTVGMWKDLQDFLAVSLATVDGTLRPVSTATITTLFGTSLLMSTVTATNVSITNSLYASGASISGNFPLNPVFSFVGSLSGATTFVQTPLSMPHVGSFKWFSVMTRTVASGASAIFDINLNGTSIFDAGTRPAIAGGGTFVSTASIATKNFKAGDVLTWDFDGAAPVHITDFNIQGRS